MALDANLLSVENEVFRRYLFYCSILCVKMLFMSILTACKRMLNKAMANPEDTAMFGNLKPKVSESVERVRRAHLNDLENILPFFAVAFCYVCTNPSPLLAVILFRVFTAARLIHTIVYAVVVVPQPARGIAFGAGLFVTLYMAVQTIIAFVL